MGMKIKRHLKSSLGQKPVSGGMHLAEAPGPSSSNNAPESSTANLPYHKKMFDYHTATAKQLQSQPEQSEDLTSVLKAHQTLAQHHANHLARGHKSEPAKKLKRNLPDISNRAGAANESKT